MKSTLRFFALLWISCFAAIAAHAAAARARELIVCGREEVYIVDLDARDAAGSPQKIWSWRAAGRADLPAEYHGLFRSTDECKPVAGGRQILITSSGGGIALVDRAKNAVLFYGRAVNAHSADLLPRGRIAVASSRDPREGKGDSLVLFDVAQPGRELWRTELTTGHGVVWDDQRQLVWALANRELRSYRLVDWNSAAPRLERVATFPLAEGGGHDLFPVPGTSRLSITTETHCWIFDRDTKLIAPHPQLGDRAAIKCISQHPATGQIALVEADRPNWWSERIQFLHPAESVSIPGQQFYKVRWNVSAD